MCLIVKEETENEEVAVAEDASQDACEGRFFAPVAPIADDEGEEYVYDKEKDPEMNLGDEQRMVRVVGDETGQICEYVVHFFYLCFSWV